MTRQRRAEDDQLLLERDDLYRDQYYVPKSTGTFADSLLAYGFASLLEEILRQARVSGYSVTLADAGAWYEIRPSERVRSEWVNGCQYFSHLVPLVRTAKAGVRNVAATDVRDYEHAWQAVQQALDARKLSGSKTPGAKGAAAVQQEDLAVIAPEHWVTIFIGTSKMQALSTYNRLGEMWQETRENFHWNLKAALALFADGMFDWDAVRVAWRSATGFRGRLDVTACQMLNPHQGKGQNREKANALAMKNMPKFWIPEYLKAAGLWRCAVPRKVREGDDRKTYVLAPVHLSLGAHARVFRKFEERLWADTSIKMDCMASLLYAETLLQHSEAGQQDELADLLGEKPVSEIVAGFHATQYKLLSRNAYTMINLGFIALPRWIGRLGNRTEAQQMREVLAEHREVLRGIEEGRSDGFRLLARYRNFLSAGRWEDFFDFSGGFAGYLMRELDAARRAGRAPQQRSFTTSGLEVIMANNKDLLEIARAPGFRNLARAIRKSTVTLQYLLRTQRRSALPYEIRYGLAQELLRKSNRSDEFLQALSEFVMSYNAENARVAEKQQNVWRREAVTEGDLDEVIGLVSRFGAPLVAHLLVAYGYARETREEVSEESPVEEQADA
jgi:hypothetical protein